MFRRGFKSWCEQTATSFRIKRGLAASDPLPARLLGEELKVEIVTPELLADLPEDSRDRLVGEHSDCWSAITIPHKQCPLVVYNPAHSPARQNSDLMHELAHILLEHEPGNTFIDPNSGLALRAHDASQEEEASWLSGSLLLPREALWKIKKRQWSDEIACEIYFVSLQMLRYRMNISGVNIQHRRSRA